jgi:hypothetical protein
VPELLYVNTPNGWSPIPSRNSSRIPLTGFLHSIALLLAVTASPGFENPLLLRKLSSFQTQPCTPEEGTEGYRFLWLDSMSHLTEIMVAQFPYLRLKPTFYQGFPFAPSRPTQADATEALVVVSCTTYHISTRWMTPISNGGRQTQQTR